MGLDKFEYRDSSEAKNSGRQQFFVFNQHMNTLSILSRFLRMLAIFTCTSMHLLITASSISLWESW